MTQTIGQRLKTEREGQRLTLEKVFEATRIRVQYLQALEADDVSMLPSPVQARGYLRNYAEFLGLDFESILEEMHAMSMQQASGKIIGPADETASTLQKNNELPDAKQVTPTLESLEKSAPIEEPALSLRDGFASQDSASLTVPIKPKPARRKKADSQPDPASAESPTKRRDRKKIEPESVPVVELEPEIVEAPIAPIQTVSQSENVEEILAPIETVSEPEPVAEKVVEQQQEEATPTDIGNTLWQTWLNRLGSVLSARAKRRTLIPNEATIIEN